MRGSAIIRLFAACVGVVALACDSSSSPGGQAAGRITLQLPHLSRAAQTGGGGQLEPRSVRIRVTIPRTSQVLLDRTISSDDPSINPDGSGSVEATITLTFQYPVSAQDETFAVEVTALDASGAQIFHAGPSSFHLDGEGNAGSVDAVIVYTGPGRDVTSVAISPRSVSVAVGATATTSCVGNPGGVTLFPHRYESTNEAIATVDEGTGVVTGIAPGTTTLVCQLEFLGTASDQITVTVTSANTTGTISGTVRNAQSAPLSGILVQARAGAGNITGAVAASATTGATGTYSLSFLAAGIYTVQATGTGFATQALSATVTAGGTTTLNITMSPPTTGGTLQGTVFDAASGNPIANQLVELRTGSAVTTGPTAATTTSSTSGAYSFTNLAAGTYTLRAAKSGYTDFSATVTVTGGQTTTQTIAMSPAFSGIRIVLTWNNTLDLDAHLTLPDGNRIYWLNLGDCNVICLEADQIGGPGSEATRVNAMVSGQYTYYVHDYTTHDGTAANLAASGATVQVYVNNVLTRTFQVPNQGGVLWAVFSMTGTVASPTITTINTMSSVSPISSIVEGSDARAGLKRPPPR